MSLSASQARACDTGKVWSTQCSCSARHAGCVSSQARLAGAVHDAVPASAGRGRVVSTGATRPSSPSTSHSRTRRWSASIRVTRATPLGARCNRIRATVRCTGDLLLAARRSVARAYRAGRSAHGHAVAGGGEPASGRSAQGPGTRVVDALSVVFALSAKRVLASVRSDNSAAAILASRTGEEQHERDRNRKGGIRRAEGKSTAQFDTDAVTQCGSRFANGLAGSRRKRPALHKKDVQKPASSGFFFFASTFDADAVDGDARSAIRREHGARAFGAPVTLGIERGRGPAMPVGALPCERRRGIDEMERLEHTAARPRDVAHTRRLGRAPMRCAIHAANVLRDVERDVPRVTARTVTDRRGVATPALRCALPVTRGCVHQCFSVGVLHLAPGHRLVNGRRGRHPCRNATSSPQCHSDRSAR